MGNISQKQTKCVLNSSILCAQILSTPIIVQVITWCILHMWFPSVCHMADRIFRCISLQCGRIRLHWWLPHFQVLTVESDPHIHTWNVDKCFFVSVRHQISIVLSSPGWWQVSRAGIIKTFSRSEAKHTAHGTLCPETERKGPRSTILLPVAYSVHTQYVRPICVPVV